jgi:DNA-binding helix-hairpin-helix protein with protein kinase domain
MNLKQILVDGKHYSLATRIGKGGEGEVFSLTEDPTLAFKLYTVSPSEKKFRKSKIARMLSLGLDSQTQLVAFPIAVASSSSGEFLGFVMKFLSGHKPLHDLYAPGSRKIHFPHADYRFLVRVATNIARAIASVHKTGCVIGDINHSSMLVSPKAMVALIDADSFQVPDAGNSFICKVGVPEYTPPELQGTNLSTVVRTSNHDAFGLAIVIFQILFMGRHPFVGTVRSGDIPPLHENIRNYRYAYTDIKNVGMDQPPGTPSISDFSSALAEAFDRAFLNVASKQRPSAEEWVVLLQQLENSLVKCDENQLHFIPKEADECPWCEMESRLGTILFLPYIPGNTLLTNVGDPGSAGFDLAAIWNKIISVNLPSRIEPKLSSVNLSPTQEAINSKPERFDFDNLKMPLASLFAAGGMFIFPQLFIIWLPIIFWGLSKKDSEDNNSLNRFKNKYLDAENRFYHETQNWLQRTGIKAFVDLKSELSAAKSAYENSLLEEKKLIDRYWAERKERQLFAYLNSFDINRAKIKYIGAAKEAILASYGIDTAANISKSRLLSLPGFGEITSKPLLDWRASLEKKFVYQPNETAFDRQEILKIKNSIQAKLAALRQKLTAGSTNIIILSQRTQVAINTEDPVLATVNRERLQAKEDLLYLGLSVPTYTPPSTNLVSQTRTPSSQPNSKVSSSRSSTQAYKPTTTATSTLVSCPRCGSAMIKRVARRGRNAGGYFWGCRRYPSCKGTRNI